jgi:hypothetical protein
MKTIKLEKIDMIYRDEFGEIPFSLADNWPFDGHKSWNPTHRCQCGRSRFLVCHYVLTVPDPDDPGAEPTHLSKIECVCPGCFPFRKGETVVGEIEYTDMVLYLYDYPKDIPGRQHGPSAYSAMDSFIPDGTNYFDIRAFDENQWIPERTEVPEDALVVGRPMMPTKMRRAARGKIRPGGPDLAGFGG